MKKINFVLWGFVAILSFHCQKEIGFSVKNDGQSFFSNGSVTIQGNVVDENGQPGIGVTIQIASKITTTNSEGYFRIVDASSENNNALVTAEKAGYFKAFRSFIPTSGVNQVMIKLIKKDLTGSVNSISGGDVSISNGSKISLPANSIIEESGGNYAGSVNVYVAYIDPTSKDISETIPGSFMGDEESKRVALTSYGMLAVQLESPAGEKLQIAPGSAATLSIPIPTSVETSAPASISLWYLDEQTGIWKQEGTAAKNGSSYIGKVKHFSFWNCDLGSSAVTLSMTLQAPSGAPLVYAEVRITRPNGYDGYGWTDSLGQVSGLVPSNEDLAMEVIALPCSHSVYSKTIGALTHDEDLGTITIANSPYLINIRGKLLNCSGSPVLDGYAIIYHDNIVQYATVNDGNFSSDIVICTVNPVSFRVLAVDNEAKQQGVITDVNLIAPETNAGNFSACGNSSQQYINYTLDGTDHKISTAANDSLEGFVTILSQPNPSDYINIIGSHGAADYIQFRFLNNNNTAGTFPIKYLAFDAADSSTVLVQPFNISITGNAQNVGEFYEGQFSGQFTRYSTGSALHNINCSFRVRRQQ